MAILAQTNLTLERGDLDPGVLLVPTDAVATVRATELADNHDGAASDDDIPIGIVVVILVLIVFGVAAGVLGFRSTRGKRDDIEAHGRQEPDPR